MPRAPRSLACPALRVRNFVLRGNTVRVFAEAFAHGLAAPRASRRGGCIAWDTLLELVGDGAMRSGNGNANRNPEGGAIGWCTAAGQPATVAASAWPRAAGGVLRLHAAPLLEMRQVKDALQDLRSICSMHFIFIRFGMSFPTSSSVSRLPFCMPGKAGLLSATGWRYHSCVSTWSLPMSLLRPRRPARCRPRPSPPPNPLGVGMDHDNLAHNTSIIVGRRLHEGETSSRALFSSTFEASSTPSPLDPLDTEHVQVDPALDAGVRVTRRPPDIHRKAAEDLPSFDDFQELIAGREGWSKVGTIQSRRNDGSVNAVRRERRQWDFRTTFAVLIDVDAVHDRRGVPPFHWSRHTSVPAASRSLKALTKGAETYGSLGGAKMDTGQRQGV
ncbi:hypothetical protein C8R45DRAFT_1127705 [Mycena sanguinolenta]|nr:hypothetical protein C8R45DRAFT_1132945 [Mycena sanguinolenta]KAJ6450679.1 hypothetical protein C8R45DRAFT_1127705 [Mycena sanguinolenta]